MLVLSVIVDVWHERDQVSQRPEEGGVREGVLDQGWLEMRMKHLDFLQSAITRMGTNSANLKTSVLTVTTAVLGFAAAASRPEIILYTLPIVVLFALMDARYLALERGFRQSYDSVRIKPLDEVPDFAIRSASEGPFPAALLSWSVALFYGLIMVLMSVVWYLES